MMGVMMLYGVVIREVIVLNDLVKMEVVVE